MRILVVDDSQFNLSIAKKHLKEIKGITDIILCHTPEDTLNIIIEKEIDIIILDVVMPILSGFDILKLIRKEEKYDDMPIIMFTSLNDIESFKTCFELGASDYISKPINAIEFTARVKAAMDSKNKSNNLKKLIHITGQQNKELKEINDALVNTKFHLVQSEKMAAIGQLAAGIAHEINNPMGFVNSNFEILKKYFKRLSEYIQFIHNRFSDMPIDPESELGIAAAEVNQKIKQLKIELILGELEDILTESESGVKRVTEIVQSLRVFARTVKDDEKDTYGLLDIINQVILISKNEIKYVSNLNINIPEDIMIYCNKVQIGQVLINIMVNAAQAIQSQKRGNLGCITVSAECLEGFVCIYIEDDGPGIPKEILTKVFEPFFTTKEIGKGTGLGLSISYDIIVNKHGGIIDIESKVGVGTKFIIRLPIKMNLD